MMLQALWVYVRPETATAVVNDVVGLLVVLAAAGVAWQGVGIWREGRRQRGLEGRG